MQRHVRVLELGREKVRMEITAPDRFDLSRVSITFTSADNAAAEKKTGDWRKQLADKAKKEARKKKKEIGFHAISASIR